MKGLSSQRLTLKVDVTGPENILFAGSSLHLSAGNFAVKGLMLLIIELFTVSFIESAVA